MSNAAQRPLDGAEAQRPGLIRAVESEAGAMLAQAGGADGMKAAGNYVTHAALC